MQLIGDETVRLAVDGVRGVGVGRIDESRSHTAETWWSTVLGEMTSLAAISSLVRVLGQLVQHLLLPTGQPGWELPGRPARSDGYAAGAGVAELAPSHPCGRLDVEGVQPSLRTT